MQPRPDTSDLTDSELSFSMTLVEDNLPVPRISAWLMIALTCGIGGLQLIWSTIFSHGSAYLFSLGITQSQSSLIWAIAPICGTIVQPVVGTLADNYRSRWGRRRPFILGGTIGIVISLTALAWIGDIMRGLAAVLGIRSDHGIQATIQVGTIICITVLNVSIQLLQSGIRALIIDICPLEQQSVASAWAGRFSSGSNIVGYMFGSISMGSMSHDSEVGRFRFLTLFSIAALVATVAMTAYFIREEDTRGLPHKPHGGTSLYGALQSVKHGWSDMPLQSRRVCCVQFFAFLGWFGFLFYSTSYVSRLYLAEERKRGVEHVDLLEDAGIRLGTFASLLSAVVALGTTVIAPYVACTTSAVSSLQSFSLGDKIGRWRQIHIIWALSHLLYTFCTFSTMFISSPNMAVFIIAITGVPWGVTQWAPFTLLGEDVAMQSTTSRVQRRMSNRSGAMMGVHNAAISVPQILAALGSSLIFRMFEGETPGGDDGIGWVLRFSGMAAIVAACYAWRIK